MVFIISCGAIDKNIIFPIIAIICTILLYILNQKLDSSLIKYHTIYNIAISFSKSLTLFLHLIQKKKSKKLFKNKNYKKKERKIYKYLLILIAALIDYGVNFLVEDFSSGLDLWPLNVIIMSIFSYYILKIKLYKHQYLSMIIIIIIGIILIIAEFFTFQLKYYFIILDFFKEIMSSLWIALIKYLMKIKFCTPYELCFYEGFLQIIFNAIYILILFFIDKNSITIFPNYYNEINKKELLIIFSYIIIFFIYSLFILITIRNYNPCYVLFIYNFQEAFYFILDVEEKEWEFYLFIVLFCILFFAFLIFNEIIELNFWGLSYNTKKNIDLRAKAESSFLEDENTDNKSNFSDDQIEIERFRFKINEGNDLENENKKNNSIL